MGRNACVCCDVTWRFFVPNYIRNSNVTAAAAIWLLAGIARNSAAVMCNVCNKGSENIELPMHALPIHVHVIRIYIELLCIANDHRRSICTAAAAHTVSVCSFSRAVHADRDTKVVDRRYR